MEDKQTFLKPWFALLLFFSLLVIGCGEKDKPKVQTERVEGKQEMGNNSTHSNTELAQINDQIQFEQWQQLVKELKSTLGKMEEVSN